MVPRWVTNLRVDMPLGVLAMAHATASCGESELVLLCLCNETNDALHEFQLVPSVATPQCAVVKRDVERLNSGRKSRELSQLHVIAKLLIAQVTTPN